MKNNHEPQKKEENGMTFWCCIEHAKGYCLKINNTLKKISKNKEKHDSQDLS